MKKFTISQTVLKNNFQSPRPQSRKRTSNSPSPSRTLTNFNRSSSNLKYLPTKLFEFPGEVPQPKKLNNYDSWKLTQGISLHTKVFIIQGVYPDLKACLTSRGWVENKDPSSQNFDLIWVRSAKLPCVLQDWQLANHFPNNVEISSKWSFCENLKSLDLYSFNSDTFFPKCFRIDSKEIHKFEDFFRLVKAINILKNFSETGIGLNEKVFVSVSICRRWAGSLERNERTRVCQLVCHSEWKIINANSSNECQFEFKKFFAGKPYSFNDLISRSAEVLAKLRQVDPQFNLYGNKNIWIVKPGRKSRGRDIALFDNLDSIKKYTQNPQKWVAQKYIENPLLISGKKFDIRQWVLVSSGQPLTVWIFKKCYLRFAVDDYEIGNLSNLYVHLTNNSISKNSKKFDESEIEGCMWSLEEFQDYLKLNYNEDVWTNKLFPKIKDVVKYSFMSIRTLGRKKGFELFGYDFMVDQDLNVWLIEVNSSPAMDYSTVFYI